MQFLKLQQSTGVYPTFDAVTGDTTLVAGTYYAELNPNIQQWCGLHSIHWVWNGALIATITIDGTNFYNADILGATGTTARWVDISAITDLTPAASASQDLSSWADVGYGRLRAKVVVSTGGVLAGSFHSKKNS